MAKRAREPSVEFELKDGYVIVKYAGKEYAWFVPKDKDFKNIVENPVYEFSIIHNFENRAMFNVEDLRNNDDILRQEVNPLNKKDVEEWVIDE